jgi:uncharacterized protein YcfJ
MTMKKLTTTILGLAIILTATGAANARHNDGFEGLVLGSLGGAIIGHSIDGRPENVIAGSIIGGTIGMLADLGHDRGHIVVYSNARHFPRPVYMYSDHRDRRHKRWHRKMQHRHDRRHWQRERHYRRR